MKVLLLILAIASLVVVADDFVFKVSDGDTVHVISKAGVKRKVRLNRIDAPELNQDRGKEAADHLASLILGQVVEIESLGKDRYGRSLDVIYRQLDPTNRIDINLQMVRDGYAWHYSYFDNTPAYIEAQKLAKAQKLGIWADSYQVEPFKYRRLKRPSARKSEYHKRVVKIPEKYLNITK